jgi:hypothetical protein
MSVLAIRASAATSDNGPNDLVLVLARVDDIAGEVTPTQKAEETDIHSGPPRNKARTAVGMLTNCTNPGSSLPRTG